MSKDRVLQFPIKTGATPKTEPEHNDELTEEEKAEAFVFLHTYRQLSESGQRTVRRLLIRMMTRNIESQKADGQ